MDRRQEELQQTRLERLKREVAARLRPVCAHMPDAEFKRMVEEVAAVRIKYSLMRATDMFGDHREPPLPPSRTPPQE